MINRLVSLSTCKKFGFYFSNKIKSQITSPSKLLPYKLSSNIIQNLRSLQKNLLTFTSNFEHYSTIAKNSPLSYVALFARSCLIADVNNLLEQQKYYSIIKKAINNDKYELNPHICCMLMQCFSYLKWEGDQGKIIEKLCSYYEKNSCLFGPNEEDIFWHYYMKIMTQKAHSGVKFLNLKRKQNEVLQFSSLKTIVEHLNILPTINKLYIKKVLFQQQKDQIFITLTKPSLIQSHQKSNKPFQILLKIKCIMDFNLYTGQFMNKQRTDNDFQLRSHIMSQIKQFNANFKKGWNTILYGNLIQEENKQIKYEYKQKNGYMGTQQVDDNLQITQQTLNNKQKLMELKANNRFFQGIFYNSTNPNKRLIDTITTLILSNPSNLYNCQLIFFSQNNKSQISLMSQFLTKFQLKQLYGYSKSCYFHQNLFELYTQMQSLLNLIKQKQLQHKLNIDIIKQQIQSSQMTKEQIKKYLADFSQVLSQLTLQKMKRVKQLTFQKLYEKDYKKVNKFIGNYGGDIYWQARPYFGDAVRIMKEIQRLSMKAIKNKEKNVKIKIITYKQSFPHLIRHILQSKYWSVPQIKTRDYSQIKIKQQILSQIFTENQNLKLKLKNPEILQKQKQKI